MALRIIGIDHGSKETLVKECGAEVFLDITKFDDKTLAEEVKKVTGGTSAVIHQGLSHHLRLNVVDFLQDSEHQPSLSARPQTRHTHKHSIF